MSHSIINKPKVKGGMCGFRCVVCFLIDVFVRRNERNSSEFAQTLDGNKCCEPKVCFFIFVDLNDNNVK